MKIRLSLPPRLWLYGAAIAYLLLVAFVLLRMVSFVRTEYVVRGTPLTKEDVVALQRRELLQLVQRFHALPPPTSPPSPEASPAP